jgi:hypothetical protein
MMMMIKKIGSSNTLRMEQLERRHCRKNQAIGILNKAQPSEEEMAM